MRRILNTTSNAAGFSLLEGLIATALLLLVVLGSLPLFTQSMLNNVAGRDAITTTNMGTDSLERATQIPFLNEDVTLNTGNALRIYELLSGGQADADVIETIRAEVTETARPAAAEYKMEFAGQAWAAAPTAENWGRITTVRQFGITAMQDQVLDVAEQLPGGTAAISIHFKEIEVTIFSSAPEDGSVLQPGTVTTMRILKAF